MRQQESYRQGAIRFDPLLEAGAPALANDACRFNESSEPQIGRGSFRA